MPKETFVEDFLIMESWGSWLKRGEGSGLFVNEPQENMELQKWEGPLLQVS